MVSGDVVLDVSLGIEFCFKFCTNQWPFQDPIHWRYLPYIRPMFQAYVREYPHKIWPYMVQYLHFRILKFPLNQGCLFSYLLAID